MVRKLEELYDVDEKIGEKVAKLYEKVLNNRGEVILTFRRVDLGTEKESGDFIPPHSYHGDIFETGVIDGELTRKKYTDALDFWKHGLNFPLHYFFSSDLAIPVKNKFSWHDSGSDLMRGMINFPPRNLKDAKDGDIKISSFEFLEGSPTLYSMHSHHLSHLERLEILIGDDEIKTFVNPFADDHRLRKGDVEDFLYFMKSPGEIEKRVEASYSKERGELANKLVEYVTHLDTLHKKILGMEDRVLKLHRERYYEGMEDMHSWPVWSDSGLFEDYTRARVAAKTHLENINDLIKKGEKIGIVEHPFVSGINIGFPSEIKTSDYLIWVNQQLVSPFLSLLKKLDGHLSEAQKVEA
ncbi:hypothetical protein HY212_02380 [Candidatus Pacearchaeota archaeon]|nr:hypothetical protein [Candidatus Pacearchaeota archaeon]